MIARCTGWRGWCLFSLALKIFVCPFFMHCGLILACCQRPLMRRCPRLRACLHLSPKSDGQRGCRMVRWDKSTTRKTLLRPPIIFFRTSYSTLRHASQCTTDIKPWTSNLDLPPALLMLIEARCLCPVWNGLVLEVLIRRLDLDGSGAGAERRVQGGERWNEGNGFDVADAAGRWSTGSNENVSIKTFSHVDNCAASANLA